MSIQPGWYQDPQGPAGQARYWDGSSWAPRQAGGAPGGPGGPPGVDPMGVGEGPTPGRPKWLLPVVGIVVVAVLVALGVWLVPPLLSPEEEPTAEPTLTPPVETTPGETTPGETTSGEATDPATEVGELNCMAASSSNFDSGPELRVAGIVVPFPHEEWGFRFEGSQWTWINDLHAWGTVDIEPAGENWAAGIVVGRLEAGNGFGEPQQAAEATVECLVTYGAFNTGEEMDITSSEAVTVDGMPGWSMEMTYPEEGEYGATVIRVLTLDSGQEGNLAGVIGFHPQGQAETEALVDEALAGITLQ